MDFAQALNMKQNEQIRDIRRNNFTPFYSAYSAQESRFLMRIVFKYK